MSFKISDKVVCVDATASLGCINGDNDYLQEGAVYVISDVKVAV